MVGGATATSATIRFAEVSEDWRMAFRHRHGGTGDFYLIETMGSGVVVFDYDEDGDEDVLFVQSGTLPLPGAAAAHNATLLRNEGAGIFLDVTESAGIDLRFYGMGATAGDIDGDGDRDLYVTAFGANRLLRNNGDGTFSDATAVAGVGDPLWGASASFADVDRDNDLDLYVTNYVDFAFDKNPICGIQERGLRTYCNPDPYEGLPDRFFVNRGDGTFEDATAKAGFAGATGKGLGVIFGDLDQDGWSDLYVANDLTANFLFHNLGDGTFEETALISGTAFDERGNAEAGMGVDLGDLDGNGFEDIVVTHVDEQTNAYYGNTGVGIFVDRRWAAQFAEPSFYNVGFGVALADLDLDGDQDVVIANGHIAHNADEWGTGTSFRQRNQVLENLGNSFREVESSGLDVIRASRGLATGDLDGDGDLDLVISNSDEPAEVYENRSERRGDWSMAEVRGTNVSIGTTFVLTSAGRSQRREVRAASSYLSQNGRAVHFGFASAQAIDQLTWINPAGYSRQLRKLPVDRRLLFFE